MFLGSGRRPARGPGEPDELPERRSSTPLKSPAIPTGQVRSGAQTDPLVDLVHQLEARAGPAVPLVDHRDDRDPRCLHTWNSFSVCGSRPLAASISMTAQSTAVSTR